MPFFADLYEISSVLLALTCRLANVTCFNNEALYCAWRLHSCLLLIYAAQWELNGCLFWVQGATQAKDEGLPVDVIARLKSYNCVKDVPFKVTLHLLVSAGALALQWQ